ncbi:MAG TPA: lactonase family protein [Rectinemataceae bacterium]|nr:lactonase family protein [Rectinemataceae bacterium]
MEKTQLVFVGTYTEPILFGTGKVLEGKGKGIYMYRLRGDSGRMDLLSVAEGIMNPSYLAFSDGSRRLFAVNELKRCEGRHSGALSAFAFDGGSMELAFLNKRLTRGTDPCHVAVDGTGRFAAVANFMSGSIIIFPILEDGSLGEASAFVQHRGSSVDKARQAGPHAHSIIFDPSNRYMLVPDLGLDKIIVYDFDSLNGSLRLSDERCVASAAGVGPRYLEFHSSGRFAYVVNELSSTIDSFAVDPENLSFRMIQSSSTLPAGYRGASTCADLHISPSGEFLYASNRGHDSIAIFGIEKASGRLGLIGHESTKGHTPRNFAIDGGGRFLLVANQDSDTVVVFRMDAVTGKLEYTGTTIEVPTPVCIKIIDE